MPDWLTRKAGKPKAEEAKADAPVAAVHPAAITIEHTVLSEEFKRAIERTCQDAREQAHERKPIHLNPFLVQPLGEPRRPGVGQARLPPRPAKPQRAT